MVQELLGRLPHDASPRGVAIAIAFAVMGLVLWTFGARLGRSLFTLVGVSLGAWAGQHAPAWFGWEIDSIGTAICGALAIGVAGYLLDGVWVALMLALQAGAAGVFVAWHRAALTGATWSLPRTIRPTQTLTEFAGSVWSALPHVIPITGGACLVAGGLLGILWPKMGRVLAFGTLGSLMLVGGSLSAIHLLRPEWIERLPVSTQAQGVVLASLIVFGAAIQWALWPREGRPVSGQASQSVSAPTARPVAGAPKPLVREIRDVGRAPAGPVVRMMSAQRPATMTYSPKEALR